jgi:hypothetical protein
VTVDYGRSTVIGGSRPMTTVAFRSSELASRVVKPLAAKAA